jgi:hypothetical protein
MASIKRWFKDRTNDVQGAYHQVNPFDGNRTFDTNQRGAMPTQNPQQRAQASIQDANQKIASSARFGVLADQQRQEQFSKEQERGNQINRAQAAVTSAVQSIPKVGKAVVKPFWETADIAKAAVQRDQNNFRQSLDQSVIGGVGRFGQSVASAALSPVSNRLADQEAARAERLLTPVYGRNNAEIEAGNIKYNIMTDPLQRSNIGVNDSRATTIRKVGAQGAEAALDILSAPATAVATKAAITSPTKQFVKQAINSGAIGAAGNVANVAQQDQVKIPDIAKAAGIGFATGVALPVATKAGGMAVSNIKQNYIRPSALNDAEVADLRAFREQAGTGAMMDDATYQRGLLAAQKAGIDYREPAQVDDLLGRHMTFQTRQAQRPSIPSLLSNERGFVRLPGKDTELMVTHNLSAENLAKAQELGGIPQASVVIVDPKKYAIDEYGEITLVGNNKLVDPKQRGTSTYASDVYSPRQPRGEYQVDRAAMQTIAKRFADDFKETGDEIFNLDPRKIEDTMSGSAAVMSAYLKSRGIKPNLKSAETDPYWVKKDIRNNLRTQLEQNDLTRGFESFVKSNIEEVGGTSKLYNGTTNSGTQRYIDDNLENALKLMRKEAKRGGDNTGGVGLMKSQITTKFKSLEDIVKNKDKLTDAETMNAVKDVLERKVNDIQDKLDQYARNRSDNQFTEFDAHMQAITDYISGDTRWFKQKFPDAPPSIYKELDAFKKELQDAPTEYFESVSDRAVKLNEFEKALIPENVSKAQREAIVAQLNKEGIQPVFYKDGQRQATLQRLMEEDNASRNPQPIDKKQGGYIQLPGRTDPLIQEYADLLKKIGEGNGVDINPETGARMTNNYRSADLKGKQMSKADWYAEAEKQIKEGKADPDFMSYYNEANNPEVKSLLSEAEAGKFGKEPLGEVAQQPLAPKAETPTRRVAPPPEFDPMERVFAANPMAKKMADLQAKRANTQVETNQKINEDFKEKGAELPTEGVKLTKNIDKAFRSTRSIIERQGEAGKELAGDLQRSRDVEEVYQAEILKSIPTVRSLKGKDYENFVDATQGLAKANSPKVEQAVAEWKAVHPAIRDRAIAAGLDVGDLGESYYPHMIDYDEVFKDKNKYNQAINHIVETGQAANAEEAIQLLGYARDVSRNRKFGNLEASRLVDIPFYDKTKNSLTSYIQGSSKRIAQAEIFGKSDEKALEKIARIGKEGGDTEAAKNAYDVAVGARQYSPTSSKVSGAIRKYNTVTKLGLGALTNMSQNVNTGIVTGHLRTVKSMLKQVDPKTRSFVEDTGVVADAVINDLKKNQGYTTFTSKVLGKGLNLVTAPGFGAVEKFNRAVAATAGRDYALRLAQTGDEATLRKLGVTGTIGKELTEEQQIQAARKVVEKTQFKVDPQDLPGWTDTPGGKLVSQFRTFSYNQGKFFSNEILKPVKNGNFMPLGRLLAAMPLGYALYEGRRMIDGRPEEENYTKRVLAMFNKIGGAGLVSDVVQGVNPIGSKYLPSDRRQSMAVSTFLGPTAGSATQAVGAVSDAVQRKNLPKDESRLEGKVAVGKTGDSYTDLTSLSRFGLQQVPIVGGPIKNRVLPFKKESEADAGKDPVKDLIASKASAADVNTTGKEDFDKIAKAAFSTPEGKKFIKLKNDDERKDYARQSDENRKLYDNYENMKKAFGKPGFYPSGMSKESASVLDKRNKLDSKARDAWDNNLSNKLSYEKATFEKDKLDGKLDDTEIAKKTLEQAKMQYALDNGVKTSKDVDSLFEQPKHKYAWKVKEWEEKSKDSKYVDSTDDFKDQEELEKLGVQKDFSKKAVDIFSMSEKRLSTYLDSIGGTDKQTWDELVKLDQAMINAGLQKTSKLDGGGSGKGRKGGKGKKIPDGLLSKAINVPSVGKVRQSSISTKAPSAPSFKAPKRKSVPKVSRRPSTPTVRTGRA